MKEPKNAMEQEIASLRDQLLTAISEKNKAHQALMAALCEGIAVSPATALKIRMALKSSTQPGKVNI